MLCNLAQLAKMSDVRSVQNDPDVPFTMRARVRITAFLRSYDVFLPIL
jgi:hypothetical protein